MGLLQALNLRPVSRAASRPAPSQPAAQVRAKTHAVQSARLSRAAASWRQTHGAADQRIATLKKSVQAHYADRQPQALQEIDGVLATLDEILNNVDHRLADSLAKASAATTHSERSTELTSAKSLLMEYIRYVKSEPHVAHVDNNPFGVNTDLKALLVTGLTAAAKAIS